MNTIPVNSVYENDCISTQATNQKAAHQPADALYYIFMPGVFVLSSPPLTMMQYLLSLFVPRMFEVVNNFRNICASIPATQRGHCLQCKSIHFSVLLQS